MLVEAVEASLAGLVLAGSEAEVVAVRMLAAELDLNPGDTDLWREFRMALKALRGVLSGDDVDQELKVALDRLGGAVVLDGTDRIEAD